MGSEQQGMLDVPEEGRSDGSADVVYWTAEEVVGDSWLAWREKGSQTWRSWDNGDKISCDWAGSTVCSGNAETVSGTQKGIQ